VLGRRVPGLLDEADDPVVAALAHERLGRYLWVSGRGEDALPEYQRAVELIPADPATEEHALVLAAYGQVLDLCDRPAEAVSHCRRAVEIARHVGAARVEAHALNTIGAVRSCLGDPAASVESCARARVIAIRLGLVQELGRSYVNGSDALDQAGRVEESIALAREGLEAMRAAGADRRYGDFLRGEIAGRLLRSGRWAEAEALLSELVAGQPTGMNAVIAYLHLALQPDWAYRASGA
jgi:tetratricopeptide (TPR) repeat protein